MSMMTKYPATTYPADKVDAVAAELQANDEDDWTYVVRHDPTGRAFSLIELYDEDGVFVAMM